MRAVQFSAYGETPTLVELPPPACPDDGAVIAVEATGVCRSDWHAWQGHEPVALPHVPGHELAGVVVEIGASVVRRQVGERVTVPFVCGCGRCAYCLAGDAQVCPDQTQPGFTGPGSFADLVAVHAADLNVVPLPDGLDAVTATSLGCRFATAFRALTTHARVQRDDHVVVHGCGGRRTVRGDDRGRARRPGRGRRPRARRPATWRSPSAPSPPTTRRRSTG